MRSPLARDRRRPPGFILPAQPVIAEKVPAGENWIHELKHDGYRLLARKERDRVQLWSRNGREWTVEFVAIVAALRKLPGDFGDRGRGGGPIATRACRISNAWPRQAASSAS